MRVPSSNGVDLELHDFGGSGPTLLIAHATGFCAGPYRPLGARLAERFRVVALDFRGHGHSDRPADGSFSWSAMIDDVLAVADHLDAGPLYGVGHSMGGACLLGAERRRPGTLRAAWVFEPIVIPDEFNATSDGSNFLSESARRRRATFGSRPEALARYAGRPPLGVFRADVLAAYVEHGFVDQPDGSITLRCAPADEAAVFEAEAKPATSHMADVDVPVTLAIGERDPGPGPADFGRHAVERLPQGRLRAYRSLGHFGPFQDPDLVADDILDAFGHPAP